MSTQKIVPNLWFNGTVKEASEFYVGVFPGSSINNTSYYPASTNEGLADFQKDLAGKELTVAFTLAGHDFMGINAGPEFTPTPANSFMVNFDPNKDEQAREHLDEVWQKLLAGGQALMPLQEYPFSQYYGWAQDKYGHSWQLMLTDATAEERPCIVPAFMFGGAAQNRANEAMEYYLQVFKNTKKGTVTKYESANEAVNVGSIMYADFMLENQWFAAMDAGSEQGFTFTEAVSFMISCDTQEEIDYYWDKLSHSPVNEQCGWCKDQFGVSWQVTPSNMDQLMSRPNAFKVLMEQKKIVISEY